MNYEKQFRATFEDTKGKQKRFRHKLNELIKQKRPVKDSERDNLFDLYNDSNLGLGGISTVFWLPDGKIIQIPNLEKFVRDIIEYDESVVSPDFFFFSLGQHKDFSVPIEEIWKQIKSKVNQVNAEALTQAIRISKEQRKKERIEGAKLNDA